MQEHHLELGMFGNVIIQEIFLCGFFVGEMVGSALSAFQVYHKREPSAEEHMEIVEIVEKHSDEIVTFFTKFNLN